MAEQLLMMDEVDGGIDDLTLLDDTDLDDEGALRSIVAITEQTMGLTPASARISCLTSQQWETALQRAVRSSLRRSIAPHLHVLRDPKDASHLFISPSAVAGVNERQRMIVAEVVYAVIFASGPTLPPVFQRGCADLVAELVSKRIRIPFFTRNYPQEAAFVRSLIGALQIEMGYAYADWLAQLTSRPDVFFVAVRRSQLSIDATRIAKGIPEVACLLAESANKRAQLSHLLAATEFDLNSPVALLIGEVATQRSTQGVVR